MGINIDEVMNNIELTLSKATAIPILGILPGGALVVVGAAQAFVATISSLFTVPISIAEKDGKLASRSWEHIQHGFGNMIGGIVKGIPFVGLYLYIDRKSPDWGVSVWDENQSKFMPYKSLDKYHWNFVDKVSDKLTPDYIKIDEVTNVFNEFIKNKNLTEPEKYDIAVKILQKFRQEDNQAREEAEIRLDKRVEIDYNEFIKNKNLSEENKIQLQNLNKNNKVTEERYNQFVKNLQEQYKQFIENPSDENKRPILWTFQTLESTRIKEEEKARHDKF